MSAKYVAAQDGAELTFKLIFLNGKAFQIDKFSESLGQFPCNMNSQQHIAINMIADKTWVLSGPPMRFMRIWKSFKLTRFPSSLGNSPEIK